MSEPKFTYDWTSQHTTNWQKLLGHLVGTPACMLEIGCWEGRSSIHFCNSFLTNPAARLVCVDPAPQDGFERNLNAAGILDKVEIHKRTSRQTLPCFADQQFDAAYIDGDHEAAVVLHDALDLLPKMKPGGIVIFDDYMHQDLPHVQVLPGHGIDCFLKVAEPHMVETIFRDWQIAVRVK